MSHVLPLLSGTSSRQRFLSNTSREPKVSMVFLAYPPACATRHTTMHDQLCRWHKVVCGSLTLVVILKRVLTGRCDPQVKTAASCTSGTKWQARQQRHCSTLLTSLAGWQQGLLHSCWHVMLACQLTNSAAQLSRFAPVMAAKQVAPPASEPTCSMQHHEQRRRLVRGIGWRDIQVRTPASTGAR
jgi:hypothetical protein